ncbi:MAG: DUF971 domain-containing protein [Alphaproteobacteria bacterium]|nr:DUF971 domain-containing protein [Alphaproteobacteria bacterium]
MSVLKFGSTHWPLEIRLSKAGGSLEIDFDDGNTFALSAELLRVQSPSAEVQGHSPEQRQIVSGRRHVAITGIEPVGNYAIAITFDDLHDTGIYAWDYLYNLGQNKDRIWEGYLEELASHGLSRDPAVQ